MNNVDMKAAIDRALLVLRREREDAIEARKKFETGGNLFDLILKQSPAAMERVAQIQTEVNELSLAIGFLMESQHEA